MEDAGFVRFTDEDGHLTYSATYTAFDGVPISQQLLTTTDFLQFSASPMIGPAAMNKGLALFPRRIGGDCGSPIETDEGWLGMTHGVGPMRTYRIGALLLDLDDPDAGGAGAARTSARTR
jgi:predicted GH43/DUF377 family glycosyl hydrolase